MKGYIQYPLLNLYFEGFWFKKVVTERPNIMTMHYFAKFMLDSFHFLLKITLLFEYLSMCKTSISKYTGGTPSDIQTNVSENIELNRLHCKNG